MLGAHLRHCQAGKKSDITILILPYFTILFCNRIIDTEMYKKCTITVPLKLLEF